MKRAILLAAALAAIFSGCDHNEYEIIITPRGKGIHRKITVARLDRATGEDGQEKIQYKAFGAEELALIAKAYRADVPRAKQDTYTFEAVFEEATPDDVGGAGSYTSLDSALGAARYYSERFRGNDDQAGRLQQAFDNVDVLVDVFGQWLRAELGKEKQFDKLARLLDQDLRQDVKNLGLMLWLMTNAPRTASPDPSQAKEPTQKAVVARAVQYLAERKYIKPADAAKLYRVFQEDVDKKVGPDPAPDDTKQEAKTRRALKQVLAPLLADKAGITNPKLVDKLVGLLVDPDALEDSLLPHYVKSEHFKKLQADWKARADKAPPNEKPDQPTPEKAFQKLAEGIIAGDLINFGTDDAVTVRFNDPLPPVATNGQWDKEKLQVVWKGQMHSREDSATKLGRLPIFCYALWARPDAAAQKRHFGKVILEGEELMNYCLWRRSLTRAEGAKWDALLATLRPGKDLVKKLQTFRFRELKAGADPKDAPPDYADKATAMLIPALAPPPPPEGG